MPWIRFGWRFMYLLVSASVCFDHNFISESIDTFSEGSFIPVAADDFSLFCFTVFFFFVGWLSFRVAMKRDTSSLIDGTILLFKLADTRNWSKSVVSAVWVTASIARANLIDFRRTKLSHPLLNFHILWLPAEFHLLRTNLKIVDFHFIPLDLECKHHKQSRFQRWIAATSKIHPNNRTNSIEPKLKSYFLLWIDVWLTLKVIIASHSYVCLVRFLFAAASSCSFSSVAHRSVDVHHERTINGEAQTRRGS